MTNLRSGSHVGRCCPGFGDEAHERKKIRDMLDKPGGWQYATSSFSCSGAVRWLPPSGDLDA